MKLSSRISMALRGVALMGFLSRWASASSDESMTWEAVASLPAPGRHHPITFANETHGFLLTGSTDLSSTSNDMYIYDAGTDTWIPVLSDAVLPAARSLSYGVVLPVTGNSKAYLGFGAAVGGLFLNDWWELDMVTLEWTQLTDFPGDARIHPAMNVVESSDGTGWEIHVGLGQGLGGNYNDWWIYTIATDSWRQAPDFPSTERHHPFYFGIGKTSYAGLGHSNGLIERDWYSIENDVWTRLPDFSSSNLDDNGDEPVVVTTEARVAGTQFSIVLNDVALGFVLSGDGDDHGTMSTGEFHAFVPESGLWKALPPHPGVSRWAPGSFVLRGTTQVYFMGGYDRSTEVLYDDMWKIDLANLFVPVAGQQQEKNGTEVSSPDDNIHSDATDSPNEPEDDRSTAAADASTASMLGDLSTGILCVSGVLAMILSY